MCKVSDGDLVRFTLFFFVGDGEANGLQKGVSLVASTIATILSIFIREYPLRK